MRHETPARAVAPRRDGCAMMLTVLPPAPMDTTVGAASVSTRREPGEGPVHTGLEPGRRRAFVTTTALERI